MSSTTYLDLLRRLFGLVLFFFGLRLFLFGLVFLGLLAPIAAIL